MVSATGCCSCRKKVVKIEEVIHHMCNSSKVHLIENINGHGYFKY